MNNLEEKVYSTNWSVRVAVVETRWADLSPEQRNNLAADPNRYVRVAVVERL